jgi:hypothetical protein
MMDKKKKRIGKDEVESIKAAFQRAAARAAEGPARRERSIEDIYHGDVPTFMELPLARKP